jgi:hypothetical protein
MAERWAVANGNYSAGATWNSGTVPTASDVAHANGFTVTVDQDVTAISLTTRAGSVAVAGGGFNCNTSRTITANILAGSTTCLTSGVSVGTPNITINGNIEAGTSGTTARGWFINNGNYANLTVNGNVTAGSATSINAHGIQISGSVGNVIVNGNVTAGPAPNAVGVLGSGVANITVFGVVTAGPGDSSAGIRHSGSGLVTVNNGVLDAVIGMTSGNNASNGITLSATARFSVTGNIIASGGAGSSRGIQSSSTATGNMIVGNIIAAGAVGVEMSGSGFGLTTTGDAFGGTGTNAHGINLTVAGTLVHNGNAKGGSGTTARGINNASTATVNVTGFAIGADNTGGVGVFNASTGLVTIGGARFGLQGWPPYAGIVHFNSLDAAQMRIVRADLASRDLRSGAFIPNYSMAGGVE